MVRCRPVSRCRLVSRCGFVFLGISGILNICNISTVSVNTVGYSLGTAIGEENIVCATGSVAISGLTLTKVDSSIVIFYVISIFVASGTVLWFFVSRSTIGGTMVSYSQSQNGRNDNEYL